MEGDKPQQEEKPANENPLQEAKEQTAEGDQKLSKNEQKRLEKQKRVEAEKA
jgi:hypothetical protein